MNTYLDTVAHNALNVRVLAGIDDPLPLPPASSLEEEIAGVTDPETVYRLQWMLRSAAGWDSPRGVALWAAFRPISLTLTRALNVAEQEHPFRGFHEEHPRHIEGKAHYDRTRAEGSHRAARESVAAFLVEA